MSKEEPLGTIIEGATPHSFIFRVEGDKSVPLHEYVTVELGEGYKVLAEVVDVSARDPTAGERGGESFLKGKYDYSLLEAEVLGYKDCKGRILKPKFAPKPNSPVYKATDQELQEFYGGDFEKLPVFIGSLIHRPNVKVSVHLQDMQFHLGIFAQTRGGKSYLAGKFIEEILTHTPFPVVVVDIHGDYVSMNLQKSGKKESAHRDFRVVVYKPPEAPEIPGLTAEERTLNISPKDITNEAIAELLGRLGERQQIVLRNILRDLKNSGNQFGLADILSRIEDALTNQELSSDERRRLESLRLRLEDIGEEIRLPAEGLNVQELLQPKTLSVVCLRGLRGYVQDAYTGIVSDLIFKNQVKYFWKDPAKAPPTFLFIEEAHRVASGESGRYAVKVISTIAREGAKFGLYLCLISQRPRSIDPDIMANIGNYAVLRITNRQDQQMIESASESFSHRLVSDLPALNQGEVVLVGPYVPLPAVVRVGERKTVHRGVTPNLKEFMERINAKLEEVSKQKW